MAKVTLNGNIKQYTGGVSELELDVANIRQLHKALAERFPDIAPHLESMAVAIDGQIYQETLFEPISPDSDVHLLPQIAGG